MRSPLITILIATLNAPLIVPLMVVIATAAPASASEPVLDYVSSAIQSTNAERAKHDVHKLGPDECLQDMALAQAQRMARQQQMFHQDLHKVQKRCGVGLAGENVAYGYRTGPSVVKAWMASPGHRANILKRGYRLIGVGAVMKDDVWWVAQVFGTKA